MKGQRNKENTLDVSRSKSPAFKYSGNYPLHDACGNNDLEAVEVLRTSKDINAYNEDGKMPLHIAASKGHKKVVERLLALGADVNADERRTGRTALHYACSEGHFKVIDILLQYGAVVFEADKDGTYPMHLAAEKGECEVVQQLHSVRALVTCQDKNQSQPLHYAARHNQAGVISTLISLKADPNAKDVAGATPLHIAASHGNCAAIHKLVELGAEINSKCNLGETPLHHACRAIKPESVATLAELGADLYAKNKDKECPIHLCAKLGPWQSLKQLLKAGVDIATPFKKSCQAVHLAAQYGHPDVLKLLKREGADLNAKDKAQNRPLHYAVRADQGDTVHMLKQLGADLNAPGKMRLTALHVATRNKLTNMILLLGRLGADFNIEDQDGLVPLYFALAKKDLETAKHLIRNGAEIDRANSEGDRIVHILVEEEMMDGLTTAMQLKANFSLHNKEGLTCVHCAAADLQADVLNHLRHIGTDINVSDKFGMSALHVASMEGVGDQVDLLNDVGADLNCRTKNFERTIDMLKASRGEWIPKSFEPQEMWKIRLGMSPLQLALLGNHRNVFDHLVTCGADINHQNDHGETAFHLAVLFRKSDWLQHLVTKGADRNCKDKLGRTPLHYAAHSGDLDIMRYLLKSGAIITETDDEGRQPIHYAADEGHYLLLPEITGQSRSVDINCRDKEGRTPLHFACDKGHIDTIQELIQLRADIHVRDKSGNTVIHSAAASGNIDTIVQLASMGCNINVQNNQLQTALHVAGEKMQGDAMEFLLMCGADPNVTDKNDLLPSTYRLSKAQKITVSERVKQFNEHNSNKNKTGEVCCEGRVVTVGQPVDFPKLNVTVTVLSPTPVSPLVFFYRTPSVDESLEIPRKGLDEILSDQYELRVLRLDRSCTILVEVPMDGYPGTFDSCFRTSKGNEFKVVTTSEENGVPIFTGKIPIQKGTVMKFAVVVRPHIYVHNVGSDGGVIRSDVDRRIRLEVPAGAFQDSTDLNLQVLKTFDLENQTEDRLFATDVLNVTLPGEQQPQKNVQVRLPLHTQVDDTGDIMIFAIEHEHEVDSEHLWKMVDTQMRIKNNCVTFGIEHFSIYVGVTVDFRYPPETRKRLAKEKIRSALQRETSILFFYATCPKKDLFLTIFECTTPGRFARRKEFWENEGFQFHPQLRHSGHFVAKPNQQFYFTLGGNLAHTANNVQKMSLVFNPRAYKYQSFYLSAVNKSKTLVGEIQVRTAGTADDDDAYLTTVPVEIPLDSQCCIS